MNKEVQDAPASPLRPEVVAEDCFRQALEIGKAIHGLEEVRRMADLFQRALALDPAGHAHARGHLAWLYFNSGQFEAAANEYLAILKTDPKCVDALDYGGRSLILCSRVAEAGPLLIRAARLLLPSRRGWRALGWGLLCSFRIGLILRGLNRYLAWWISRRIIRLADILSGRNRFSTGAYMKWVARNNPGIWRLPTYSRAAEMEFTFTALNPPPNALVLDIGTGPSPFIPFAATRGIILIGSDPDGCIRDLPRDCLPLRSGELQGRLTLVQADGRRLPFRDHALSSVVSISTIEHIPENGDIEMMREVSRILAPGGRAVITTEGGNEFRDWWRIQSFRVGLQYDTRSLALSDSAPDTSVGFYRTYSPDRLVERLGAVGGLDLIEAGYLVDRLRLRGWFPDRPSTFKEKILNPWQSLIGRFAMKRLPLPIPEGTDLTGAVAYLILEKPSKTD
ncbi:MAG: methyltransferase domain-containing protein [Candidatus Omnitrophica bacterium]|nr:methyltransferase domain-containing protein [Candidatus Omnitrophota bacterium]